MHTPYKGRQLQVSLFPYSEKPKLLKKINKFLFLSLKTSASANVIVESIGVLLLFYPGFKSVFFVGPVRYGSELHHLLFCKWTRN